MKICLVIGLMFLLIGCNSNPERRIDSQHDSTVNDTVSELNNDSILFDSVSVISRIDPQQDSATNEDISGFNRDYMLFDSVFINCKIKASTRFQDLESNLGKPDSIIKCANSIAYYEDSYSYIKYKNFDFHLYDNGQAVIDQITIGNTNNRICYKDYEFNSSTTINEIKSIFPNSYLHRDTITVGEETLTAIRLFTAHKPTSDELIMLFFIDRLEYFSYFDGND